VGTGEGDRSKDDEKTWSSMIHQILSISQCIANPFFFNGVELKEMFPDGSIIQYFLKITT
jgi:hypothetical protein